MEEAVLCRHPEDGGGSGQDRGEEGGREGAVPPRAVCQARVVHGAEGSTAFTVALTWVGRECVKEGGVDLSNKHRVSGDLEANQAAAKLESCRVVNRVRP